MLKRTVSKRSGNNTDFSTKQKQQERLTEDHQMFHKFQFYVIKAGEELGSFKDTATKQKLMNKTLEDCLKLEVENGPLSVLDTTIDIHIKEF
ncbi:unnamed protein product [Rangifer tarandus platyrhynchus]|uniref:Uncharacterized protein n=2 Tax=Rangifer tarandus platyrhynchus TaxID=3082113 RepID=A0ACB0ECL7_RANTA|nr:unnamed protein product [Rangifer tarandus platyrhynchus]CAI9698024.1 unnamed protein product [Rangifer tarandus platyrhynchus]